MRSGNIALGVIYSFTVFVTSELGLFHNFIMLVLSLNVALCFSLKKIFLNRLLKLSSLKLREGYLGNLNWGG